ncbi:DUF6907 domain-containing protein [Streptomyces lavendulocolor]|uniref:DUF6907 domain-containing protein n=1 Tax=Streptomyces lavendulocolor TaxID=67316 RepID=UPI0033E68806
MTVLHDAPIVPSQQPRSWSFVDRVTGERRSVTCMPGCATDHAADVESPTHPDDIYCARHLEDITLPINVAGEPEEFRVMGMMLSVNPFDRRVSQRLPHIDLEVVDDHWIEGLDPDGLETVIGTLQARLEKMRAVHAELVRVRAEYRAAH